MTDKIRKLLSEIHTLAVENGFFCEYVFGNENGQTHKTAISDCCRNKSHQAGIDGKCIHAIRRTLNSRLRTNGVSAAVAASMLGHTEEVNERNYTYDASDIEYKKRELERAQATVV